MAAQLNRPFGIAFDPNGDLYVSDTFNARVRKVKLTPRACKTVKGQASHGAADQKKSRRLRPPGVLRNSPMWEAVAHTSLDLARRAAGSCAAELPRRRCPVAAAACTGDCDGDGAVTVNEILVGVNIALDSAAVSSCPDFDNNQDGSVTIDELLAAVNNALGACPPAPTPTPTVTPVPSTATPTPSTAATASFTVTASATATVVVAPIFPANYRATYTVVRDCRFSGEHGLVYIRVLANSLAAQPYLNNANPLPVGSTVVKEEFSSADCSLNSLVRWRAMRKEAPGFDPVDGDWHWQWVETDRSVTFNDKSTCISCHVRPACLARDHMCTLGQAPRGTLQQILDRQPAALLSISGTSASDVYAVGADPGDGFGPYVLHYNGAYWQRLTSAPSGDLWWISVPPIDGAFYMAGAGGLVLRYNPLTNVFTQLNPPGTETLFGIWGTSAGDIWAVGGNPTDESGGGVAWHFDGLLWSAADLSALFPSGVPTLYKVWGRSPTDVYAVGRNGTILHYNGSTWAQLASNTTDTLFTVHGNATLVAAMGGLSNGVILEPGGQSADQAPPGSPQLNGVFVPPDGLAVAVGIAGSLALRRDERLEVGGDWTGHGARFPRHLGRSGRWHLGGRWRPQQQPQQWHAGVRRGAGDQLAGESRRLVSTVAAESGRRDHRELLAGHPSLVRRRDLHLAELPRRAVPIQQLRSAVLCDHLRPGALCQGHEALRNRSGRSRRELPARKAATDAAHRLSDAQRPPATERRADRSGADMDPRRRLRRLAGDAYGHADAVGLGVGTATRTPTPQPTANGFTPGPTFTPNPACAQPGTICTRRRHRRAGLQWRRQAGAADRILLSAGGDLRRGGTAAAS